MNWKTLTFTASLFTGFLLSSCVADLGYDDGPRNAGLNDVDKNFLVSASTSNSTELAFANLATHRASSPQVLSYAQAMLVELQPAQSELKDVANSVNYPVKDSVDPAHVTMLAQLGVYSGRQFDSAYMYIQKQDHETTLPNYQNEQASGLNATVKSYASKYQPQIEQHLTRADSITTALFPR